MTRYRPDIDGLRAIAVASVVLFHAGLTAVKGGFVGVDVFFVISGYLITANLHGDLERGRFSIASFYERRARRILPALYAMMLGAVLGAALFLPDELKLFGESVTAAALSLSNVFFLTHTGYFDLDAAATPLLHTWSLAVEEQFYIVFPVLLWVAARLLEGRRVLLAAAFGGLWILSFALGLWQVGHAPRAAFYLPFDRAWELLTGALLVLGAPPPPRPGWRREGASAAGLALVLLPPFTLSQQAPFPGPAALAPCLGAALLIWSGGRSGAERPAWTARLLQAPPLVGLGLISYSLYLWHWPLLVFARYYAPGEPGPLARGLTLLVALAVAAGSWRWIERPFRGRHLLASRPALFGAAGAGVMVAGLVGVVAVATHGLPARLAPEARLYAAGADDYNRARDRCFALTAAEMEAGKACRIGAGDGRAPSLMVWGDSHADALMPAFDAAARAQGITGLAATHGSCPPLLGIEVHEHADNGCPALNVAALDLIERDDIRRVVLAARWGGYAEGRRYFTPDPPIWLRRAGASVPDTAVPPRNHALLAAALAETVVRLRREGREVYLVLPAPEVDRSVPDTLARNALMHRAAADFAPRRSDYDRRQAFARAAIDRVARASGAVEIDPAALLCPGARCRIVADGRPLYYDADHLSTHGAGLLAPLIAPVFEGFDLAPPRVAAASGPAGAKVLAR